MRRKLYSSKKVSRTGLVYTREMEKEIQEQRLSAQIYVFAPKRLLLLIEKNRRMEMSFN